MSLSDKITAPSVRVRTLKGHLKIELFDAESGERIEKIEKDNLVTNAIQTAVQAYAGTNQMDAIMPLATLGLGGIMLFDGVLDADADNVLFPEDVHLTGFGVQGANTSDTMRGSKNEAESLVEKGANGRARTVWDFGTSQANGVIASVALTKSTVPFRPAYGLPEVAQVRLYYGSSSSALNGNAVLAYVDGYVYFCRDTSYTRAGSGGVYIYTYTMSVHREYCPMGAYKVGDGASKDQGCSNEPVQNLTWQQMRESSWNDLEPHKYIRVDYSDPDESAYLIWSPRNSSGNGRLFVTKFERDGTTWAASDAVEIICTGAMFAEWYGIPVGGYYLVASHDGASFYKISMTNPQDIRQVALPDGWRILYYTNTSYCDCVACGRNGAVYFTATTTRTYGTRTETVARPAILYPDGTIKLCGVDYSSSWPMTRIAYACEDGYAFAHDSNNYIYGRYLSNYLGTIANLPSPITKNASQTLKITYTLVDA